MRTHYQVDLLHILWSLYPGGEYTTPEGQKITVIQHGEYDENKARFCGGKVLIEGSTHYGDIVIWAGNELPKGDFESTIVHVSPYPSARILRHDGAPVPQIIHTPDPVTGALYEELRKNAGRALCSRYIAAYESHDRIALYTRLMVDRLYGRYREVMQVYEESEQDWNATLYVMLLRAMGKPYNNEPFAELARRVSYKHICKEKSNICNVEALLLGAAGLLEIYEDDPYIRQLKETFNHMCRKYGIVPMRSGQWDLVSNRAEGQPVMRLAQLASFFMKHDFLFDRVMKCRTVDSVQELFRVEASLYWSTHYKPVAESPYRLKKLGHDRANTLGINFVVPVQFAYGIHLCEENTKDGALDLLEKINRESNHILSEWRRQGTVMENAFDSQAILQLNKEFCKKGLCWKCPVGKRAVKEAYKTQSAQKM